MPANMKFAVMFNVDKRTSCSKIKKNSTFENSLDFVNWEREFNDPILLATCVATA